EQRTAGDVDAGVRGLSRKDHGDEQLIGIARFELGRRRRVRLGEAAEEFEHLLAVHCRSSSAEPRRFSASSKSSVGSAKPTRKRSGISNQRPGTMAAS